MKMLVIAVDGYGAFRCGLVKNPDLFRREIAAEPGAGYIVRRDLHPRRQCR